MRSRIWRVIDDAYGKVGSSSSAAVIFAEISSYLPIAFARTKPALTASSGGDRVCTNTTTASSNSTGGNGTSNASGSTTSVTCTRLNVSVTLERSLEESPTHVVFNFPPDKRLEWYLDTDYDVVQEKTTEFASLLSYRVGFTDLDVDMPILGTVRRRGSVAARACGARLLTRARS